MSEQPNAGMIYSLSPATYPVRLRNKTNNVAAEAELLFFHIREVLAFILGPDTGFPDFFFCSTSLQMLEYIKIYHDHILSGHSKPSAQSVSYNIS